MILKLYQLIEYQTRRIFMEKSCKNVHKKLFLDPFLILVNNSKQPMHARNSSKNRVF